MSTINIHEIQEAILLGYFLPSLSQVICLYQKLKPRLFQSNWIVTGNTNSFVRGTIFISLIKLFFDLRKLQHQLQSAQ